MALTADAHAKFRFEHFEVCPASRQLLVDGQPAKLGARALDLLLTLIERRERVVSKNELLDLVWPGLVVEEGNLTVHMAALRKLLGPGAIATIPGRGYKFASKLHGLEAQVAAPPGVADAVAPAQAQGNVPLHLAPLYGRDEDLATILSLIGRRRLVSLVGPGGIGKTRLAQAVAHGLRGAYPDGAWLVELAPLVDPALVVSTVARALGHQLGPAEKAVAYLVEAMSEQRLLLVLDNCEQVASTVAELTAALLRGAPHVHLLITSQEPLHLTEEQVERLRPLAVPEAVDWVTAPHYGAVALFAARARAADGRFELSEDNVAAVIDICSRLDGIALAIELAAARVPLLGVQGVRQRLSERLRLLAGGERTALPRHRTLRAALEWSYGLLSDDERTVLDRLGVFNGGFSIEAAQKVASDAQIDEWAVLDHLWTLVDKSLVMVEGSEPLRYRQLETTRALALERLDAEGATASLRRRHALALVQTFGRVSLRESTTIRLRRNARELDNVRAAASWAVGPEGDKELAIELLGVTDRFWYFLGCSDEGARLFRAVEPWVSATTPPLTAAWFWQSESELIAFNSLRHQAESALRAADLFRAAGDAQGLFVALSAAANVFSLAGDRPAAERAIAEARSIVDPAWAGWVLGFLEFLCGQCMFFSARQPPEARLHYLAGLQILRRDDGDDIYALACETNLVVAEYALRRFEDVVRMARAILARPGASLVGFSRGIVSVTLGAALVANGDLDEGETTLRASLPLAKRATGTVSWALNHVAMLAARQGRLEVAARLLGHVDGARTGQSIVQSPSQRLSYDDALAIVVPAFAPGDLERLRAEGRALTEDQVTALALPPNR